MSKDIDIDLEDLKKKEEERKVGEVFCADTESSINLKILHRPDDLKLGQPLVIETDKFLYYCLINRLYFPLNEVAVKFANSPFTDLIPPSQIEGVRGKEFFGLADLSCLKILPLDIIKELEYSEYQEQTREFDTIPPIFSLGRQVTEKEIKLIYKTSEYTDSFGVLRGFKYEIPIDFEQLVKKPYGLFGRTGIGKSILNKILCLLILKHQVSQLLLFDMQGEYGLQSRTDKTKGLAWYFGDKIQIYRIGVLSKKEKIVDGAETFFIYKEKITSGDIIASAQTLKEPAINILIYIENELRKNPQKYNNNLFDAIKSIKAEDHEVINALSLRALRNRIIPLEKYDFLIDKGSRTEEDSLENIFNKLLQGKSIIIDFGKFGTYKRLYYFVANMISRRLYELYSQREEDSQLPPLVIVVEEAHKFLKPRVIDHTIFGEIAREMRKFQMTLAFVDQRPSQIDDEVYSQIANTFALNMIDQKDIDRVVKTLPNPKKWRPIISGLIKRQCFTFGDAIAVPTVVQILDYKKEKELKGKLGQKKAYGESLEVIEKADWSKLEE